MKSKVSFYGIFLFVIGLATITSFLQLVAQIGKSSSPSQYSPSEENLPLRVQGRPIIELARAAGLEKEYCRLLASGKRRIYSEPRSARGEVVLAPANVGPGNNYKAATLSEVMAYMATNKGSFANKRVIAEGTWIVADGHKQFSCVSDGKSLGFWDERAEDWENLHRAMVVVK